MIVLNCVQLFLVILTCANADTIVNNVTKLPCDGTPAQYPIDCTEVFKLGKKCSGVYMIKPERALVAFKVYCLMEFHRGWTVIMRRYDGSQDFNMNWVEYKNGFGDLSGEHYLGNDKIHLLTFQPGPLPNLKHSLRIDMVRWSNNIHFYAEYEKFTISSESNNYTLHVVGYYGNVGDQFIRFNGSQFSTHDRDNDKREGYAKKGYDCAKIWKGAFWYGYGYNAQACTLYLNLMGPYQDDCSNNCMLYGPHTPQREVVMMVTRYNPQ